MFVFGLFSGGNCKAFLPLCFCVCFHLVFSVVIVFVFGTMCLELYLVGIFRCWVQQARPCLVATADLIISYPMQLSAPPHLTNIFSHYLLLKYTYMQVQIQNNKNTNTNMNTNTHTATNTDLKFLLPHATVSHLIQLKVFPLFRF